MSRVLPILFSGDMVLAILDGRKTVTRRVIKPQPKMALCYGFAGADSGKWRYPDKNAWEFWGEEYKRPESLTEKDCEMVWTPPCHTDDVLYVRETWGISNLDYDDKVAYIVYKASEHEKNEGCQAVRLSNEKFEKLYDSMAENSPEWRPSIHMPKEATRIWLKVTNVRGERLHDMNGQDVLKEGINSHVHPEADYFDGNQKEMFEKVWNSTIKKSDFDCYGWNANPWVWVIEFERCEKPEEVN